MYPFKKDLSARQKNISPGVNTCEFIVLHHTATGEWTLNGNIKTLLWETKRPVSCHFLIDTNGDAYKLGDPKQILWHAGESKWLKRKDLNKYSVGIELIGPIERVWFTDAQRHTTYWLTQHLMAVLWVPKENVIRHKDIAPWRKPDVADALWWDKYNTYKEWQNTLSPREYT